MITSSEAAVLAGITLTILTLLGASEAARRGFGLSAEFSRKSVHIATGIVIFLAPFFITRAAPVVLIAAVFTLANLAAYVRGWLPAVHHTPRRSYGTVYYPLALLILALLLWDEAADIVAASMLVLALGDGAAGITGELVRAPRSYTLSGDTKSVQGSMAMFLTTLAALHVALVVQQPQSIQTMDLLRTQPMLLFRTLVVISVAATAAEALTPRGLDNLSIPLLTAFLLYVSFGSDSPHINTRVAEAGVLGALVAGVSYRQHLLSLSGAVATFLLAIIVYGTGGLMYTLPIVAFFLLSSALSRLGRHRKRAFDGVFEKSSTRDAMQVIANGGIAGLIVVLAYIVPWDGWYPLYLASLAAATADTWSTELGVLARGRPRSILTLRPVPPGTSGGVSLAGTVGGALGAAVVSAIGLASARIGDVSNFMADVSNFMADASGITPHAMQALLLLTACGLVGSLVDSILGATVQAQYSCGFCGAQTEQRTHCHLPTTLQRGHRAMTNDIVNIACTLAGALTALALLLLD